MTEPAGPELALPRAFLRVGGFALARHQLAIVLALGCERIVCVARGILPGLVELQHVAEDHGARFHVVSGPRGLIGLIAANDELIVLADGLLIAPDAAAAQLEAGQGVLVQPIELGQPAGFERIDLNHAAAGAMRLPGTLVERLAELPADIDIMSSLQRIALQAGVVQRMLPSDLREVGAWRLIRDEAEAQSAEAELFREQTSLAGLTSASEFVARLAARAVGPALLHAGSGGNAVAALAAAVLLLAGGAGWFQSIVLALMLCASADVLRRAAGLLLRIERQSLNLPRHLLPRELLFGWAMDVILVSILSWSRSVEIGENAFTHVFPAIMLVAMLRLLPDIVGKRWSGLLEDRGLLCLILALIVAGWGGMPAGLVAGLAVALAALGAAWPGRSSRLTPS